MSPFWSLQFFDPSSDVTVVERRMPHWSQSGTICFITWRTNDSIPKAVLDQWHDDRAAWLRRYGIDLDNKAWKQKLLDLPASLRAEFSEKFTNRWHEQLDACQGECVLKDTRLSSVVADSLLKFDGEKYEMIDFVVMPNHVHLIAAFPDESGMLEQCRSWKHFTAYQIHRRLKRKGVFWQQESFDHLVRSESQFEVLRKYVADNGPKANLRSHEYRHYSKEIK